VQPIEAPPPALDRERDPNYMPPPTRMVLLGLQHILAMFVSNVTPAIIVMGAAGFGVQDKAELIYMIQMSMVFAGVATLFQTIGAGPIGARLPLVQGTSFAFLPVMLPLVAGRGAAGLAEALTGALCGGFVLIFFGFAVGKIRAALPPLVTGLVVLMIGLSLVRIAIQYAAGGVPAMGTPAFGAPESWALAMIVVFVTLGLSFFARGILSTASVLIGLIAGYAVAFAMGRVDLAPIADAAWGAAPRFAPFGFAFSATAIFGFCMMVFVSAIETIGDVSAIAQGAGRDATDKELRGAVLADGVGTSIAALFGGLPNTTFGQNVGLVAMTGVMSRHVVTFAALLLIACGLVPKVGALVITTPIEVLGGGVIVMFGMVASAGLGILSQVQWSQRNMLIFGTALSLGLGLQLEPTALQHLPPIAFMLLTSGVLPAALVAIVLNLLLPNKATAAA
jgi:NCS2 family nucleobase:cation symporter-2